MLTLIGSFLPPKAKRTAFDTADFAPDGESLAVGGRGGLWLLDAATGKVRKTLEQADSGPILRMSRFSPDGRYVCASFTDRSVRLWTLAKSGPPRSFAASGPKVGIVTGVAFSKDGKTLLTGDAGFHMLRLWEVESGEQTLAFKAPASVTNYVALLPDGKRAFSAGGGARLYFWNLADGTPLQVLEGNGKGIECLEVARDGKLAISGTKDGTAQVWDLKTGALKGSFAHKKAVNAVALAPGGKLAASGSYDGIARVWEIKSGREVASAQVDAHQVSSLSFSPDGARLATCGPVGTLSLFAVAAKGRK